MTKTTLKTENFVDRVPDEQSCIAVALGVDHSLFLMSSGAVWTCGSNAYHQVKHGVRTTDLHFIFFDYYLSNGFVDYQPISITHVTDRSII